MFCPAFSFEHYVEKMSSKKHKYDESYMLHSFTSVIVCGVKRIQCVITNKLLNRSMRPAKLNNICKMYILKAKIKIKNILSAQVKLQNLSDWMLRASFLEETA